MSKNIHNIIGFLFLILVACARIGTPTGGPKDVTPPKVVECKPANYSTLFSENRITIEFNEFIKSGSFKQELIISPPLKKKPEIFLKGKTMVIDLEEELMQNTTYTFDFGEAIQDFTEGNILKDFQFVFSTGSYLDSLSLKGRVINAFDHEPLEEKSLVMLYNLLYDSVPYDTIPKYIGRVDDRGYFSVNNIPADTFLLFALQDVNNNYLYDQPNEMIAFPDSLIILTPDDYVKRNDPLQDSINLARLKEKIKIDSLLEEGVLDTMAVDSMLSAERKKESSDITLFMFLEDNKPQYLKDYTRDKYNLLSVIFNRPLKDSLEISLISDTVEGDWYLKQMHGNKDTIDLWITDTTLANNEEVEVAFTYQKKDSTNQYTAFTDTLKFSYKPVKSRKKEKADTTVRKLKLQAGVGGKLNLNKPLAISTDQPVLEVDTTLIQLNYKEDTIVLPTPFDMSRGLVKGLDTFPDYNRFEINKTWESATDYILMLFPGAFTDVYDATHDTTEISFRTYAMEDYSNLELKLSNVNCNLIIQLFNEKEKLAREEYIDEDGDVHFNYLHPGEGYSLKVIYDRNNNKRWDTGDYDEKRQPEKVVFYKTSIDIRENWDVELIWELP